MESFLNEKANLFLAEDENYKTTIINDKYEKKLEENFVIANRDKRRIF